MKKKYQMALDRIKNHDYLTSREFRTYCAVLQELIDTQVNCNDCANADIECYRCKHDSYISDYFSKKGVKNEEN